MTRYRRIGLPLIAAFLMAGTGCEGRSADESDPADSATRAAPTTMATDAAAQDSAAATRAALPRLLSIMMGLQRDMERIGRGLWAESYDTIAVGARAVADHPMMGPEGIQKIQGALGEDMARFKGLDTRVHDLAVELESAARDGDLEAVLGTEARLRQACVQCHTEFRDRLRESVR